MCMEMIDVFSQCAWKAHSKDQNEPSWRSVGANLAQLWALKMLRVKT